MTTEISVFSGHEGVNWAFCRPQSIIIGCICIHPLMFDFDPLVQGMWQQRMLYTCYLGSAYVMALTLTS